MQATAENLTPRRWRIEGTPEPSRSILRAIINREPNTVRALLAVLPSTAQIGWAWEPYVVLTWPEQLEALQLVMDDRRFQFHAEFVVGAFYFTNMALRNLVIRHRRASRWLKNPELLEGDYQTVLGAFGWSYGPGLQHRGGTAARTLRMWKERHVTRFHAAVILTMRLTAWARWYVEHRVVPAAKARFEATAAAVEATA